MLSFKSSISEKLIKRLRSSTLARNTVWAMAGQGTRVVIQALYFVVIARALGPEGYGAFAAVVALVAILEPFAGLGTGNILIKEVSRNAQAFNVRWGNALIMTWASGLIILVPLVLAARLILPQTIPLSLVFLVASSELLLTRLLDISGHAFQAFHLLKRTVQFNALISFSRLIAALLLAFLFGSSDPVVWGMLYFLTGVGCAITGVYFVHRELGRPEFHFDFKLSDIKEGFYFSVNLSAQSLNSSIDKAMLARLSTLEATGIYASATKIVGMSFEPIRSLAYAAYTKFFQEGASGIQGSLKFAKRLIPIGVGYGALVWIVLFLTVPLAPVILGEEYRDIVEAIRWLALLPLIKSLQRFAGDTLTGAGYQGWRSSAYLLSSVFNVLINLWLIPAYLWRGAAWASLASNSLLALSLWGCVWFINKRSQRLLRERHSGPYAVGVAD